MSTDAIVLGLDIGGSQVRAAVAAGEQIIASQAATWPPDLSPTDELHFAADLALQLAERAGFAKAVSAVGVALAALTDEHGNVVSWPNRPAWAGLPCLSLLAERLAAPVVVEDDANAAALAEWMFGAGRGFQNLLVVTVGTGIGAGLILDGRPFRGQHGWAGELGHIVVLPDGAVCACGHRGCLQTLASGRALERVARARHLDGAPAVTTAALRGEDWACEELAACGRWLGLAAANVVNLLDLEAVVVGGGLSVLGEPWWAALVSTFEAHLLGLARRKVALRRAALPDTGGVLGAVSLALRAAQPEAARAGRGSV